MFYDKIDKKEVEMFKSKKILIVLSCILLIGIFTALWFIFDINSELDLLLHKEKYSYKLNFASHMMQNDWYFGKYYNNWDSFYKDLKNTENKYSNKSDENSIRIIKLNNLAFDKYHDIISLKENNKYFLSADDVLFLTKINTNLAQHIIEIDSISIDIEDYKILHAELNKRREVIKVIKNDLKQRKIDAIISIQDINYENLMPAFLDEKDAPKYIQDFTKLIDKISADSSELFNNSIKEFMTNTNNNKEEVRANYYIDKKREKDKLLFDKFSQIDDTWKHRYIALAIEKKKNGDKIFHLYEVYPFKDGNRYYWNIEYYPPESQYLKGYLKMLNLLLDL